MEESYSVLFYPSRGGMVEWSFDHLAIAIIATQLATGIMGIYLEVGFTKPCLVLGFKSKA